MTEPYLETAKRFLCVVIGLGLGIVLGTFLERARTRATIDAYWQGANNAYQRDLACGKQLQACWWERSHDEPTQETKRP
jgi:alpha-D-ribose 1-methylphosphonate 5-triphosphate synthase subunit PhnG